MREDDQESNENWFISFDTGEWHYSLVGQRTDLVCGLQADGELSEQGDSWEDADEMSHRYGWGFCLVCWRTAEAHRYLPDLPIDDAKAILSRLKVERPHTMEEFEWEEEPEERPMRKQHKKRRAEAEPSFEPVPYLDPRLEAQIQYLRPKGMSLVEAISLVEQFGIERLRQMSYDERLQRNYQAHEEAKRLEKIQQRPNPFPTGASHQTDNPWNHKLQRTHRRW